MWEPPLPVTGDIRWERLGDTSLSRVAGAEEDDFSPDALVRAAQETPTDEVSVRVVRNNEGKLVHELREGDRGVVLVPSGPNEQVSGLALFTDLIPGIEVDVSAYPHELLGIWARDGQVRAFWSRSPSLEPFETFPSGSATYTGDAVGLHAAVDGATAKFLAKVNLDADFQTFKVKGTVSGFRLSDGSTLDDLTVNLVETDFSKAGEPFSGEAPRPVTGRRAVASGAPAGRTAMPAPWEERSALLQTTGALQCWEPSPARCRPVERVMMMTRWRHGINGEGSRLGAQQP